MPHPTVSDDDAAPVMRAFFVRSSLGLLSVLFTAACARPQPESSPPASTTSGDAWAEWEARLDAQERELTELGWTPPLAELGDETRTEDRSAADSADDDAADEGAEATPSPSAEAAAAPEMGPSTRASCTRICDLEQATCDLAAQICALAERHSELRYRDACRRAQDQCQTATTACQTCSSAP